MVAVNEELNAGPGTLVTVGPSPSIIRDTITVTQPPDYEGNIDIIQSELNSLSTIGLTTVNAVNLLPDASNQCSWRVTFETNASDLPSLEVAPSGSVLFSKSAILQNGDIVTVTDDVIAGTSDPLSGHFTVSYEDERSMYLPYDVSAEQLSSALENLSAVGEIEVSRQGPDINNEFIWDVTFLTNLGDLDLLGVDWLDLTGTAAKASVSKVVSGVNPPFDGAEYGSSILTDLISLSVVASPLKQGIDYFFRVSAINSMGAGPYVYPRCPYVKPLPQPPSIPSNFQVVAKDGNTVKLTVDGPNLDGGNPVTALKVEYGSKEFKHEKQRISLNCTPLSEVQVVTTSSNDVNEVQYIIMDSFYQGGGVVHETQRVQCDASGGNFGLRFEGKVAFIDYDASSNEIKEALESLININKVTISMDYGSRACLPFDGTSTGDFTVTFESVVDITGDLPEMTVITQNLEGARHIEISTTKQGDAPLGGKFHLSFRGFVTDAIDASLPAGDMAVAIDKALESLDTIEEDGISVFNEGLRNGGEEKVFKVEFTGVGVGGNVLPIQVVSELNKVTGSGSKVIVLTDGESFLAKNEIDLFTSRVGNSIQGSFRLKLRGHVTDVIPFNASADLVKSRLDALSNIGEVAVSRSPPTKERGYSWSITFVSNPGPFPIASRNVDTLEYFNSLTTTVPIDDSATISIYTAREGDLPLSGKFTIAYDNGLSLHTTGPLESFATATEMKEKMEQLPNVGVIDVVRVDETLMIAWDIEFTSCSMKNGVDVCNDGNLLPLVVNNLSLGGCGGVVVDVSEIVTGKGADVCPDVGGVCSEQLPIFGDFPFSHEVGNLSTGVPYFFRISMRNSEGFGASQISDPLSVVPRHNAPGPPPPVELVQSTSSSITLSWQSPTEDGGTDVSGYELWMDEWNGGSTFIVYDGSDALGVFEYTVQTGDSGPLNQVVEAGRQYRFLVRAMNYCNPEDQNFACYGEFSDVRLFTVRDPRRPLPPAAPKRDPSTSIGINSMEASITVSWVRPIDNGGSPITGYILYMKRSNDNVETFSFDKDAKAWTIDNLRNGDLYRFHIVAVNSFGRSGNSPTLTVVAGVVPGQDASLSPTYVSDSYRPVVTDVQETSMTVEWTSPSPGSTGGTPITGYKLYMYSAIDQNTKAVPEPVEQEVQDIIFVDSTSLGGTFTVAYMESSTESIRVEASTVDIKTSLENLPGLNSLSVDKIPDGWRITFDSEAGDVPLLVATSGRLTGLQKPKAVVTEFVKGNTATLVYDGTGKPDVKTFTINSLTPDELYAFKVAPLNAVGDGILTLASTTAAAREGASAKQTTASGSAILNGIAGSVDEEQIITFSTVDCSSDKLVLHFHDSLSTMIPCDATALQCEQALSLLEGIGEIHVSRNTMITAGGQAGYAWTVTFSSLSGDVPLMQVDLNQVNNGKDSLDVSGNNAIYVSEFLKGMSNEFTIEPKKASGAAVRDVNVPAGFEGSDIFFTELWNGDCADQYEVYEWYADGGVASYNPVRYEKQVLLIQSGTGPFTLTMDTRETQPKGRIDGSLAITFELPGDATTELLLQDALKSLSNVGNVKVSAVSLASDIQYTITFVSELGELPLLSASDGNVIISRTYDQIGVTEIQQITTSVDKAFVYEIQTVSVLSSAGAFALSFNDGPNTNHIACNFQDAAEAAASVLTLKAELEGVANVLVNIDSFVVGTGSVEDPWEYRITFLDPIGAINLLQSDNAEVSEVVQGKSYIDGTFVLSYNGRYTSDIPFDASARYMKVSLEKLATIDEVNVQRVDKRTGYEWNVTFTKNVGNLESIVAHKKTFGVQIIDLTGGDPTPLGGSFILSYLSKSTMDLPFDISSDSLKNAIENQLSIIRVDVEKVAFANGQSRWLVTFRQPDLPEKLLIDTSKVSGSIQHGRVFVSVEADDEALRSLSGVAPTITVKEKVAGRPSYTGTYSAALTGSYCLSVLHLENGGLNAKYYDNQWLLGDPVVETVHQTVDFNWGSGPITTYGRDYVSIQWRGKVKPKTSESYTFFVTADDGVKLYIDHVMVADSWDEDGSLEKKSFVPLNANVFHDIMLEYKEETGSASIRLEWSSNSIEKQVIPVDQLYFSTHISGSPFTTVIVPGAADYPFSTFIDSPSSDRSISIAGETSTFYIQAKV